MKNHPFLAFSAWTLSLSLLPAAARADGPAPSADRRPDGRPGEHGKPDGKPFEHGKPGDDAKSDKGPNGEHGRPGVDDDKSGRHGFRGPMRQLREELKTGKLTKDQLKDKLAKLRESVGERGKEHRHELSRRWGGTLALPAAREELKNHARRMAFLDRALVLAETEAKDKDKDKLNARISKLIDKEDERHERAMERFKSMPAPAASAPAAATPPPAAAGSAEGAAK